MRNQFSVPVSVELGRIGLIRNVSSVREAAECITSDDWPDDGPERYVAAEKLLAAREGRASEAEAREAFEAAAIAAGILITGWTEPLSRDAPKRPTQWSKRRR